MITCLFDNSDARGCFFLGPNAEMARLIVRTRGLFTVCAFSISLNASVSVCSDGMCVVSRDLPIPSYFSFFGEGGGSGGVVSETEEV